MTEAEIGTARNEIANRRTFAIISHPDAGKTTLTEKLLLYGGAIHLAGSIKQNKAGRQTTSDWMAIEKERGITFVVLAGAEPSLVPELCRVCFDEMPLGAIATNGLAAIPENINYRIHISVWGNEETSFKTRKAKNMLARQIENYKGDPRAVWVYTFTRHNIHEAREVVKILAENNCKATFNMFSAPVGYT